MSKVDKGKTSKGKYSSETKIKSELTFLAK